MDPFFNRYKLLNRFGLSCGKRKLSYAEILSIVNRSFESTKNCSAWPMSCYTTHVSILSMLKVNSVSKIQFQFRARSHIFLGIKFFWKAIFFWIRNFQTQKVVVFFELASSIWLSFLLFRSNLYESFWKWAQIGPSFRFLNMRTQILLLNPLKMPPFGPFCQKI